MFVPLQWKLMLSYLSTFENVSQAQFSNKQKGYIIQRGITLNVFINEKEVGMAVAD